MKKIIVVISIMFLSATHLLAKPFNTSFKVGMPYSSVQFLLSESNVKGKKFLPSIGLSYFSISMDSQQSEGGNNDFAVRFIMPRVGARILGKRREDLNSYYIGELFFVIPFISGTDISDEEKEDFKDATNLLGLTAGWGVEYFFSKSFAIGGEATFNMIFHSLTNEGSNYDGSNYKNEFKTRVGATVTQITFNYYFN